MKIAILRITPNGKLIERKAIPIQVKIGDRMIGEVVAYGVEQVRDFYSSIQDKI